MQTERAVDQDYTCPIRDRVLANRQDRFPHTLAALRSRSINTWMKPVSLRPSPTLPCCGMLRGESVRPVISAKNRFDPAFSQELLWGEMEENRFRLFGFSMRCTSALLWVQ